MSSHTFHPDIAIGGLDDACERCHEHAQHPWRDLDPDNLRRLVENALDGSVPELPTANDQLACANIRDVLRATGQIARECPDLVLRYLDEQWGVSELQRLGLRKDG